MKISHAKIIPRYNVFLLLIFKRKAQINPIKIIVNIKWKTRVEVMPCVGL